MSKKASVPIGHAALLRLIDEMSLAGMARALKVQYQLIQGWTDERRKYATPADYVPRLVQAAREQGIEISEAELRPDVWSSKPAERAA